jgi:succinate-semialdehyde dehydrogenase/glutarate-semialdehyde dehydrogenase
MNQFKSENPATQRINATYPADTPGDVDSKLERSVQAFNKWKRVPVEDRCRLMREVAVQLRCNGRRWAELMTQEMGKLLREAEGEIEKCALGCEFYADNGAEFLLSRDYPSNASESYVQSSPLGTVLGVMPWNFPFWQVIRFAVPTIVAGNSVVLKHASNVPGCALALQELFEKSGFPQGVFQTLLIGSKEVATVISDVRVAAVSLTGSEAAGKAVAREAGSHIKKCVLELGGIDPFIVLEDADLKAAAATALTARYQNCGQSCIAAKRLIVVEGVYEAFVERFLRAVKGLVMGDPMEETTSLGPLAKGEFRDEILGQIKTSVNQGGKLLLGGRARAGVGYFLEPTVLVGVSPEMSCASEEVFGPVAPILCVRDACQAIEVANATDYGLGASLWTADLVRAKELANELESGQVFINSMVTSDPRLPFGGVKKSGYGRELAECGVREFVNLKTVSFR